MEKMNFNQIMDVLQKKIDNVEDFAYGDFDKEELGLGHINEVDSYGGEGQGDRWYVVFYFVDHDVFIRVDGFYSSYNGTDFWNGWGNCKEVKPEQRTITVYENI